ncbi:MAG: FtsW/RodA/SpoVE family cell cycle protein [Defluviitaleaceae bacterium]|nr:FtsW/RodA/SpoVE family cell cycle protein [Defluviitaleaceae bacterium]
MYGFLMAISRYYFTFVMVFFLGFFIRALVIYKRKGYLKDISSKWMRILLLIMIASATLILAYDSIELTFSLPTLLFGLGLMTLVVGGSFLFGRDFKKVCPLLENGMLFLLSIGLIMLYRLSPGLAWRQLIFATLGFVLSLLDPFIFKFLKNIEKLEFIFLMTALILISLVTISDMIGGLLNISIPIIAVDQYGAANQISIIGFAFQPSEMVKFLYLMFLACALRNKPKPSRPGKMVFIEISSAVLILALFSQGDLGNALLIFLVFVIMVYASRGSKRLFFAAFIIAGLTMALAYTQFPIVRLRISAWLNPWTADDGSGIQIIESFFAIGSWGPWGAGLGYGMPDLIPVVERDVIFAAITEEFGWIFSFGIIITFLLLMIRFSSVTAKVKRPLFIMMSFGYSIMIAIQAFVSISGNIGLLPISGVTLPLISYGGSSVFVTMLMFGIMQWLYGNSVDELIAEIEAKKKADEEAAKAKEAAGK